jgi:hypothetical protein
MIDTIIVQPTPESVSALIKDSNRFCILPWIHFHAWPDGKVFPCCMSDSRAPVSDTTKSSVIEIVNSTDFKELRANMLNDKPSKICERCYDVEQLGTWSLRQSNNVQRGEKNNAAVCATNLDGSIDEFTLKYLDIRFSNICNFKCRSCGPSCSSQWAQEHVSMHGFNSLKEKFKLTSTAVTNNEGNVFWEKLKPYLLGVEEVYFAGGEALITPEHYRILDYWLEHDKTDVRISYTTNFSVFKYKDKNVIDYWKKFKDVEIFASIDATGDLAEFMRKGTVWSDIEDNVRMIQKEVPHVKFTITPTISTWNVHQFPQFHADWIKKGFLTNNDNMRLNLLTFPWHASILILPKFYKEDLIKLYEQGVNNVEYSKDIKNAYKSVIHTLTSGEENKDGVREFFEVNQKLDNFRKENILDVIPRLTKVKAWANS